jgi:hypothetical protein
MAQPPAPALGGALPATEKILRDIDDKLDGAASTYSTEENSVENMGPKERDEITDLARQLSRLSRQSSSHSGPDEPLNPFLDPDTDPRLDPNSEQFSQKKWVKNILHITSRDPERYRPRTAGASFRNLNAYGFGTAADYQSDVFNTWLKAFGSVKSVLGLGKKLRIDILRDFEGLVRSGEMLVVLGRPGRYVFLHWTGSTFPLTQFP